MSKAGVSCPIIRKRAGLRCVGRSVCKRFTLSKDVFLSDEGSEGFVSDCDLLCNRRVSGNTVFKSIVGCGRGRCFRSRGANALCLGRRLRGVR